MVEIQRAVIGSNGEMLNRHPSVASRQHPRGHVRIMIESGHDDLVTGIPSPRQGPAELKAQRGHIRAKDHTVGIRHPKKISDGRMDLLQQRIALATGRKHSAMIGVGVAQVVGDGLNDTLGRLATGRAIEEYRGPPADLPCQSRKLRPAPVDGKSP